MPDAEGPEGAGPRGGGRPLQAVPMAGGAGDAARAGLNAQVLVSVLFVLGGAAAFLAGALLLAAWSGDVSAAGGWSRPHTLALVHILALGFVTSLAIGVLYHLTPLMFGRTLPLPAAGLLLWAGILAGTGVMTFAMATVRPDLVATGAILLGAAVLGVAAHLGAVVVRSRRHFAPTVYETLAFTALPCVAVAGATLAVMLDRGPPSSWLNILGAKIVLAIGGWLGLLVAGVSYQLVPMFTLPSKRPRFLEPVLALMVIGVVAAAAACLAGAPAWVRVAAGCPYAAGALLHAADILRMVASRRHRGLEPGSLGQALGAGLFAAGALAGAAALSGREPWPQLAVATALGGWAPVLIVANATRIVPFILWQGLPPRRRPRTWAPAPASLGWVGITAACTGWALLCAGIAAHVSVLVAVAAAALLVCAASLALVAARSLRTARLSVSPEG